MARKKKAPVKKAVRRDAAPGMDAPASTSNIPEPLREFLKQTSVPKGFVNPKQLALPDLRHRVNELNLRPTEPGPRMYTESRSRAGLRMLLIVFASVAALRDDETSNVMSWSTNWPK